MKQKSTLLRRRGLTTPRKYDKGLKGQVAALFAAWILFNTLIVAYAFLLLLMGGGMIWIGRGK